MYRAWKGVHLKDLLNGKYVIMVRAINRIGNIQPQINEIGWNAGGYQYNAVDAVNVKIV